MLLYRFQVTIIAKSYYVTRKHLLLSFGSSKENPVNST